MTYWYKFLSWLIWNVPLGRLAPHIMALYTGAKAIRVYRCVSCNEEIPPGEEYHWTSGTHCQSCADAAN